MGEADDRIGFRLNLRGLGVKSDGEGRDRRVEIGLGKEMDGGDLGRRWERRRREGWERDGGGERRAKLAIVSAERDRK